MGLLDKLWDDVVAGPQPDTGLNRLRRHPNSTSAPQNALNESAGLMIDQRGDGEGRVSQSIAIAKPPPLSSSLEREGWAPSTPSSASPSTPPALESPIGREKDNVWRSVFHPGRNHHMKKLGSQKFDKAELNTPTVYDWLYSKDSKSTWR